MISAQAIIFNHLNTRIVQYSKIPTLQVLCPTVNEQDDLLQVSYEEICSYMSMLENEQRLTDAGYTINR